MRSRMASNFSCGKSLLTSPQKTLSSDEGSRTMALSLAARPVCSPVSTMSAPCAERFPSPRRAIISYSSGVDMTEHAPLGRRHVGVAGSDDLSDGRDALRAIGERRDRLRAADAVDLVHSGKPCGCQNER